jgi:hypothetical protein
MQYVNLTPHAVNILAEDGTQILSVPPSGTVARIAETAHPAGERDGIPFAEVSLGDVHGLPAAEDGVTLIGSMPLLMAMAAAQIARPDAVYPYGQVRDGEGRIIGCRSLATMC